MKASHRLAQFRKASRWLEKRNRYPYPVVSSPHGYAQFIAYVYRIDTAADHRIWFLVTVSDAPSIAEQKITGIKRICTY